jgi:hypothetical protein
VGDGEDHGREGHHELARFMSTDRGDDAIPDVPSEDSPNVA